MQGKYKLYSATLRGVEAVLVTVEVYIGPGMPGFSIVGMPDIAIQEARERVRAALKNCEFKMPSGKITVNLSPSWIKKTGSGFDLPIALGILAATKQVDPNLFTNALCVGELSLEGNVASVRATLAYEICAKSHGLSLIAGVNTDGEIQIDGLDFKTVKNLSDLREGAFSLPAVATLPGHTDGLDFADVSGNETAKRALQIAATGSLGVLMMGPPGSGKTMLASRVPSILPPLTEDEKMETTLVYSVAGEDYASVLSGIRPFRKPHHSISAAGLVGGGSPPRPGEISLATNGVLFLDELAEFKPNVLQSIRQPLESGTISITRADGNVNFPASFMLLAASNPCPCGYYGDSEIECRCPMPTINKYQNRIGGPLIDRFDMNINVWRQPANIILNSGSNLSSSVMIDGVIGGIEFAQHRRANVINEAASGKLAQACDLDDKEQNFLEDFAQSNHMSGRGISKTLKIARTIADLAHSEKVLHAHLCEAFVLRLGDGIGGA